MSRNRLGLSRSIPASVKREVRRRSKFGCVICRKGFFQYEHILPFEGVSKHDPEHICCLCGSCHDSVTRGQLSKAAVIDAYKNVQRKSPEEVGLPFGPLDFHSGAAVLQIGGLRYPPSVTSVVRYHGQDVVRVTPGVGGEPGAISAVFTDDDGEPIFELRDNEWIGRAEGWDIEVVGSRLAVRKPSGDLVLAIRLEPPGTLVVERLDMRIADAHLVLGEKTYAVGRYMTNGAIGWVHAELVIPRASANAVAIEFTSKEELEQRIKKLSGVGQSLATADNSVVCGSPIGCAFKDVGISIGYLCALNLYRMAAGSRSLDGVRHAVWNAPEKLLMYLGTGRL